MILQAIVTKYLGPTNVRGSRVKATASARSITLGKATASVTLGWDHSLNSEQNHARAAKALAEKLEWHGHWHAGGMPNDSGYVFVCSTSSFFMTLSPEGRARLEAQKPKGANNV